jgi:hypothetical protein
MADRSRLPSKAHWRLRCKRSYGNGIPKSVMEITLRAECDPHHTSPTRALDKTTGCRNFERVAVWPYGPNHDRIWQSKGPASHPKPAGVRGARVLERPMDPAISIATLMPSPQARTQNFASLPWRGWHGRSSSSPPARGIQGAARSAPWSGAGCRRTRKNGIQAALEKTAPGRPGPARREPCQRHRTRVRPKQGAAEQEARRSR